MFLSAPYRRGWIHYGTYGNRHTVSAQWFDANGDYHSRSCKSEHAAKCFLSRRAKEPRHGNP